MPVINVGKLMKEEAKARNTKKMNREGNGYKVSKKAIEEMTTYLEALIDNKIGQAIEHVKQNNRNVILERDIIAINSYMGD